MDERLIPIKLQLFAIVFSVVLLLFIIELIRKNKLKEGYSILWFVMGLSLLAISVWTDLLANISFVVGVEYEPAMLLAVLVLGILVLMIHFSVIISGLDKKSKILAQFTGFLFWENKCLREEMATLKEQKINLIDKKEQVVEQ